MCTSHFWVSTHQFIAGGVKGVDTEDKEGSVPEAVCLSLQGLDLVVCAFEWSGGYGMIIVRQICLYDESGECWRTL